MKPTMEVHKLDDQGNTVWTYRGKLLTEEGSTRVIEATFDRGPIQLGFIRLEPGYKMIEYFYRDRWYNIFEIFDHDQERVGWYCNIARPAEFEDGAIYQRDLALDLIVGPGGKTLVLDREEFAELDLNPDERQHAAAALNELKEMASARRGPFETVDPPT